jgi:hypothetical protein
VTSADRVAVGHAEEFVQFTDPERLVRGLVEGVQMALVDSGLLGRIKLAAIARRPSPVARRREFGADPSGGGQLRETRFGRDEHAGQVRCLTARSSSALGNGSSWQAGRAIRQELGDVHAAAQRVSRQAGAVVVRRPDLFVVEAQQTREAELSGR